MCKNLTIPENYNPILSLKRTEKAIKQIKDFFQLNLMSELRLRRVTAPLYVRKGTGVNDDLNGIEKPVEFTIKNMNINAQVVQSLAKWKRLKLVDYNIKSGYGIYTDMNAIRPDEVLDNLHSLYVDQWDWEKIIKPEDRDLDSLKKIVSKIYEIVKRTEFVIYETYPDIIPFLPEDITFVHTEELIEMYPDLPPIERENKFCEKHKAIFIIGIGGELGDGTIHDGRAPDYDDWTTPTENGYKGLNGDIVLWNPVLNKAFEISSMGIRVNSESLLKQLEIRNCTDRKELYFHKRLINGELPQSIGGGLGQSRICMYLLRKAHIGEVQASIWPDEMAAACKKNNIVLM